MDEIQDRKIADFYATGSGLISSRPCWLFSVIVSATGAGQNTIVLHDGQDTSGPIEATISCIQYDTIPIIFGKPKYFSRGLYINVSAGTVQVAFQYKDALR